MMAIPNVFYPFDGLVAGGMSENEKPDELRLVSSSAKAPYQVSGYRF
jgi:hypothetical protein